MFVLRNYAVAVVFCVVTMLCWGSWANTANLAKDCGWRFELFYWDYVFGVLLMALIFAFTLGNIGKVGRKFLGDLRQAEWGKIRSAFIGGMVFNAANILLVAAIDVAGMSVAFPVGIGLALVLGVVVNYWAEPKGDPVRLFAGVALIAVAIVLDAWAYSTIQSESRTVGMIGLGLSLACGLLMGFFYRFVAAAMPEPKPENFINMPSGKLSPYSAMVIFSLGILASQIIFNFANILDFLTAAPARSAEYFSGGVWIHLWGIFGGMIWAVGMTFSIIAFGMAGPAISYGLGQGATMVAAFWGVVIWREFRDAPSSTTTLILLMFAGYIAGLALLIFAGTKEKEKPS